MMPNPLALIVIILVASTTFLPFIRLSAAGPPNWIQPTDTLFCLIQNNLFLFELVAII